MTRTVLVLWICQSIAHGQPSKIEMNGLGQQLLIALPHAMSNGRSIMPTIALTDYVQRIGLILRIGLKEGLEEVVCIF